MNKECPPSSHEVAESITPLICDLPASQQHEIHRVIAKLTKFEGPLPPPHLLKEYEQIIPGGAERLLMLLEKQAAHRSAIELQLVSADIQAKRRGQAIAAVLGSLFGIIAGILGYFDHDWLAGCIALSTITSLAVIFVLGKQAEPSTSATEQSQ
ncbi:DUF2335 domain-containing protein [Massilia sp. erpn]|uniref:DUF2335 domain-containing protein n=1 Tax=Massilia sp. erpn TaxID=2738142 RepID=UPI0021068024|nr:DUF2335 domain-containing protein [Massilia sp. erpn]UTY58363.1 DUF2335 domain-containing protein [Massilia sp. erpn]